MSNPTYEEILEKAMEEYPNIDWRIPDDVLDITTKEVQEYYGAEWAVAYMRGLTYSHLVAEKQERAMQWAKKALMEEK